MERKNPSAARKVVRAIRETCRRAGEEPGLASCRDDLGPGVRSRMVLEYPYRVYFLLTPQRQPASIRVIRILHQRRDVESAFDDIGRG